MVENNLNTNKSESIQEFQDINQQVKKKKILFLCKQIKRDDEKSNGDNIFSSINKLTQEQNMDVFIKSLKHHHIIGKKEQFIRTYNSQVQSNQKTQSITKQNQKESQQNEIETLLYSSQNTENYYKIIQARINNNNLQQQKQLQQMPQTDQRFFSKFERIQNKFQEIQDIWTQDIERFTTILNRPVSKSIMLVTDEFRPKVQVQSLLEAIQPPHERYGAQYWQKMLRQTHDPQFIKNIELDDPEYSQYYDKNESHTNKDVDPKAKLSRIRSSILQDIIVKSNIGFLKGDQNGPIFKTYQSEKYLQEKLQKNQKNILKIRGTFQQQLNELVIIGDNKLKLEKNCQNINEVKTNSNKNNQNQNEQVDFEETILRNYNMKQIYRLVGSAKFLETQQKQTQIIKQNSPKSTGKKTTQQMPILIKTVKIHRQTRSQSSKN